MFPFNQQYFHYINIYTNYNFIQLQDSLEEIDDTAEKKIQATR